jgi:UDP-glucose 4-epimerase
MHKLQTVLLTGATGFIGSHLLEALLAKEYEVVVLKRSTSDTWRIEHLLERVMHYNVDEHALELAFEQQRIDVVIHLATKYRKFDNVKEVPELINANITLPVQLIELAARSGVKAFINTGTFFEYDCSIQPIGEERRTRPLNFYAKTKLAFESMLMTYSDRMAINTFRLFSPYGEKDNQKLISTIIKSALSKIEIQLSEGFQKADYIYVSDIVCAYLKAIKRLEFEEIESEYEVFNLGSGSAFSVRDIVSLIEQQLGREILKSWGPPSMTDIPIAYSDNSKANNILGWQPVVSIEEGIRNTILYHEKKGLHDS